MGGRDQLLGARLAVWSLGPRRPGDGQLLERATCARQRPGPARQRSLPDGLGFT